MANFNRSDRNSEGSGYNLTQQGQRGLDNLRGNLPSVGLILTAIIIIGILVM